MKLDWTVVCQHPDPHKTDGKDILRDWYVSIESIANFSHEDVP